MKKIEVYKTISSNTLTDLESNVNKAIVLQGFQPYGELKIIEGSGSCGTQLYVQVLVLYKGDGI